MSDKQNPNDRLDEILASLPTPSPRPGFWDAIDSAIAAAEPTDTRPTSGPPPSTEEQSETGNVIAIDTRRARTTGRSTYVTAIGATAATILLLVLGAVTFSDRPTDTTTDPADESPIEVPQRPPVSADNPPSTVFDSSDGYVELERIANLMPAGTTIVFDPRYDDFNDDGIGDLATIITTSDGTLSVIAVDGRTGQQSGPVPLEGETVGAFVVRDGRITITTSADDAQIVTELATTDGNLTIDRATRTGPTD